MTVYRGKKDRTYRYDFHWKGQRYSGYTGQEKKRAAEDVERKIQEEVKRAAAGLPPLTAPPAPTSPTIQDWAEVYIAHQARRGKKLAPLTRDLTVALKFFGQPPAGVTPADEEPYHHLTLLDVANDPMWVEKFEQWLDKRRVSIPMRTGKGLVIKQTNRKIGASAKNHYRSAMSGLFKVALLPKYRALTHVTANPWDGVPRDRVTKRTTMVTSDQLRAWVKEAAYHVKLALTIAALAPKLRLANILGLRWVSSQVNLQAGLITVQEHKTAALTGLPLVVPITPMLGAILEYAHRRRDKRCDHLITYKGRRVRSLKTGLRASAKRAGLTYGLRKGGATFHTLRHYAATTLAALGVPEALRRDTMGHQDIATTQIYTHLAAQHQRAPLAQLAEATPLQDLFIIQSPTNFPTTARRGTPREVNSS
jgi:integrase